MNFLAETAPAPSSQAQDAGPARPKLYIVGTYLSMQVYSGDRLLYQVT